MNYDLRRGVEDEITEKQMLGYTDDNVLTHVPLSSARSPPGGLAEGAAEDNFSTRGDIIAGTVLE
jgi:hypothetical protein